MLVIRLSQDTSRELGLLTFPCLSIPKVILHSKSKGVHHHGTRGRDNFRVQQHRTNAFRNLPPQVVRFDVLWQTEVRNETVVECCPGSVWLYNVCVPACAACANMRCDTPRNCSCTPGYIGPQCNQ
ncbi:hypothetical protein J6590_089626, partial [Homalodisca vitripennis]